MAIAMTLTALSIGYGLTRILPRLDPIRDWIAGERDEEHTERAWEAAVGLPLALVRDEILIPMFTVVIPSTIAARRLRPLGARASSRCWPPGSSPSATARSSTT